MNKTIHLNNEKKECLINIEDRIIDLAYNLSFI